MTKPLSELISEIEPTIYELTMGIPNGITHQNLKKVAIELAKACDFVQGNTGGFENPESWREHILHDNYQKSSKAINRAKEIIGGK